MNLFSTCTLALLSAGASASAYQVEQQFPIGGSGSYDYVRYDAAGHRLFLSHQDKVEVVNADTGALLGQIAGLHGVHGIALAPDLNKGFISNGLDGTVAVFDPRTLQVTASIKTGGEKPDAIEYDAASHLIVVSNGHSNNETLIDARTNAVLHLISLPGNPESIAFDGRGHAVVNVESHNSVAQIDLATGTVLHDWPVGPGEGPTGLAVDRQTRRAFVSCGGNEKLVVLALDTGAQIAVLPVGDDSDAVTFNPDTGEVFSSNRDGTLTVIHQDDADHFRVADTVKTQFGAKTMALDPAGRRLFLPVAQLTPGKDEDHPGPAVPNTFKVLLVK